ncbi:MAG: sugar ABC transporter permease [Candidatus Aerophobetes bacterium]|nr:sugar ABC transporter permease [Candidatus Aerophobetes bacterium]
MSRTAKERTKHILIAPTLAFFIGLTLFPLIFTIVVSLSHLPLGGKFQFRGLENYSRLITDRTFLIALKNTLIITVIAVIIEYLLGLGLALLVGREIRGGRVIRLLILLPMMMPPVAVGFMWKLLYHQTLGPINHILKLMSLPTFPWTTQPGWALFSIILVDVWQWISFIFIILLAAIVSLPREPFESAKVDGATSWQIFRDMTFPLILPASIGAILLRSIELFKLS